MAAIKNDPRDVLKKQPVYVDPGRDAADDVEVTHARLATNEPLTIDDDEFGGDPYNSTGRFSALLEKKRASEG